MPLLIKPFKAIFERVEPVQISKNKNKYRYIIVRRPAPVDQFNDTKFPDDVVKIYVQEKHFQKIEPLQKGDKIEINANLICREYFNNKDILHTTNISLYSFAKIR